MSNMINWASTKGFDVDMLLRSRLQQSMLLTDSLAEGLDQISLHHRNGGAPSSSIGSQFWCVVGARESYSAGIVAGHWTGFMCSLSHAQTKQLSAVQAALARSRITVLEVLDQHADSDGRSTLAFDLLEHEAQHQGQLIRYFYTNSIAFPVDFAKRYALQQPTDALT